MVINLPFWKLEKQGKSELTNLNEESNCKNQKKDVLEKVTIAKFFT